MRTLGEVRSRIPGFELNIISSTGGILILFAHWIDKFFVKGGGILLGWEWMAGGKTDGSGRRVTIATRPLYRRGGPRQLRAWRDGSTEAV